MVDIHTLVVFLGITFYSHAPGIAPSLTVVSSWDETLKDTPLEQCHKLAQSYELGVLTENASVPDTMKATPLTACRMAIDPDGEQPA